MAPDLSALHPEQLQDQHDEAKESALNEFHSKRPFGEVIDEIDEYTNSIVEVIEFILFI